MASRGRLILRGSTGGLPKNQSMACEARHAPTGPSGRTCAFAHARPAPCVVLSRGRFVASRLHGDSRAAFGLIAAKGGGPGFNLCGSSKPPSLQTSKLPLCVQPAVAGPESAKIGVIGGSLFWQSCFVYLRGSSCSSCQPRRANLPHSPSGSTRRALVARSLFSVAVEGLALWACTLCFLFSGVAPATPFDREGLNMVL